MAYTPHNCIGEAFQGFFFQSVKTVVVSGVTTIVYTPFPMKYIAFDKWSSTPNQREEVKAWRDDNTRELFRVTASGKKSVFQFTTRENLTDKDVEAILNFFTNAETNTEQRKITLQFFNEEDRVYKQGDFYRPNMPFKMKSAIKTGVDATTGKDIYTLIYEALTIDLIQY